MSIESSIESRSWVVATQVKSHRVVYFTDDPDYQPPMDGDWYYLSPHTGTLPPGMTLRNCWRWRFDGMEFVDAGQAKPAKLEDSLLASNKKALLDMLHQRIDALRRPLEPSSLGSLELRRRKLSEAQSVLNRDDADTPLLRETAAAYLCTLEDMAQRIVEHDRMRTDLLLSTECQRETLAAAIVRASTQQQLMALRSRIVEEIVSAQVEPKPHQAKNTTPDKIEQSLTVHEVASEQLRLRVQLRNQINDMRRPHVSHYLLDEHVLARKAELAVAVHRAGGAFPEGLDGSLLVSHAAAREQGIAEAAREVLAESRELRETLVTTERMKDALLSRIARATTVGEIRDAARAIGALKIEPTAQPSSKDVA